MKSRERKFKGTMKCVALRMTPNSSLCSRVFSAEFSLPAYLLRSYWRSLSMPSTRWVACKPNVWIKKRLVPFIRLVFVYYSVIAFIYLYCLHSQVRINAFSSFSRFEYICVIAERISLWTAQISIKLQLAALKPNVCQSGSMKSAFLFFHRTLPQAIVLEFRCISAHTLDEHPYATHISPN